jgi:hypothetical protein
MELISLEDFDPNNRQPPFLTSPTSLEACRMHGIEPEELLLLTPAEHRHVFGRGVSSEVAAQHYSIYCKKREDSYKRVVEQRNRLLRSSVSQLIASKDVSRSPMRSVNRELQESQQRELERLERKQQIELKKVLDKEMSREQIEDKKAHVEAKAREREQARLAALAAKQQEIEDKRLLDEEKRRQKAQLEAEQKRLRAEYEADKERRRTEEEAERTKVRLLEAYGKEEQRRKKREAKEYIATRTLGEQKQLGLQRAAQLEERERKRQEMLEEQAKHRASQSRILSEKKQAKLASARHVIVQNILQKQEDFTEKQRQSEEKRRQFEIKRAQQQERARIRAEMKEEELRRIRLSNQLLEEKRKQEFSINMSRAEIRHMEQMSQLEAKLREKQLKAFEKQCRVEMIQSSIGQQHSLRSEQILEKQAKKEEMVETVRQKLDAERQMKMELAMLKEKDSQLARQRQIKMEEYRRGVVLEKLEEENERMKQVRDDKRRLQAQKLALREQVEAKKTQILEGFGKLKLVHGRTAKEGLFSHLDDSAKTRPYKTSARSNEYHEARIEIEKIKQSQAEELLTLIQKEQAQETQREQELINAALERHQELEDRFGSQRAAASHKIEALAA